MVLSPTLEVPQHATQDLCVLDNCGELELCLGDPLAEPPMNQDYQWDMWFMHHGPSARAHHYLSSLDLGNELSGPNAVGGLEFFEDANMVS